ncbi:MAG: universal stress protein [Mycobacteriaceae bacterium]
MSDDQPSPARNHIVVGVDGSVPSQHALRWGRFLAQATDSTMEAVSAWQPPATYGWAGIGRPSVPADWNPTEDAHQALVATLDEVFGKQRPATLELTVREGNPAKVLLDISNGARMLIVGSRGHGGFAGLLLGSVSTTCAEHATCPVLIVHGTTPPPPLSV